MASITHYLRNNRLDLIGFLACLCLVLAWPVAARADVTATEISRVKFERAGDSILLTATVKFELSAAVHDALLKGVAVIFVAEVDIMRERWYWMNKNVVRVQRHMRLAYQPLTRRWRLNVASGMISNSGLGLALNQNFETLAEALAVIQRLSRWKIADTADVDLEQHYLVDFRFRLDTSQLPRPLQIGTLGQADWDVSASSRQALVIESTL